MKQLEAAARSRSEADWLVGMNATRAAIDPAARRIRRRRLARPRPDADTRARRHGARWRSARSCPSRTGSSRRASATGSARYAGRYLGGKRIGRGRRRRRSSRDCEGKPGEITKLEKKEEREQPQLLYDLTSLQRHANTLFGFSARRTLAAAQRLYEEHKAITYPRTNSRFLLGEMVARDQADARASSARTRRTRGRRVRDAPRGASARPRRQRREGHRPPRDHPDALRARARRRWGRTSCKIYDLVAKRFLAVFHPEAVFERTRVETTVEEHVFRTSGRVLLEAGWKRRLRRGGGSARRRARTTPAATSCCPPSTQGESVETRKVESLRKETQPPRRFTEASLLGAMEAAGKDIEDAELREAMKDSGIGTPATRAAIIERLITVGYIEREGRALHATEKGMQVI